MDILLYIVAVMIFWDFSTHVIELFNWDKKFLDSQSIFSYYYPHLSWKKTSSGPVLRENRKARYQRFWASFWGLAFILILIYILFK